MLEDYFTKPSTIDRIRASWLAPQIEHYVEWMHKEGYADRSVLRRVPLLCRFADFASHHGASTSVPPLLRWTSSLPTG